MTPFPITKIKKNKKYPVKISLHFNYILTSQAFLKFAVMVLSLSWFLHTLYIYMHRMYIYAIVKGHIFKLTEKVILFSFNC